MRTASEFKLVTLSKFYDSEFTVFVLPSEIKRQDLQGNMFIQASKVFVLLFYVFMNIISMLKFAQ